MKPLPRPPIRFSAYPVDTVPNKPGCWNSQLVGVFEGDTQIGSYTRNYSSFMNTFEPFETPDGQWFALASRDYTCTELLALPSCEWVGGEKPHGFGFCPVDLYVPRYLDKPFTWKDQAGVDHASVCRHFDFELTGSESEGDRAVLAEPGWKCWPYGFVAGCVWGDDSSWKIEAFDLREAAQGKLTRLAPWGRVEMGTDRLIEAIQGLNEFEGEENLNLDYVRFITRQTWNDNKMWSTVAEDPAEVKADPA